MRCGWARWRCHGHSPRPVNLAAGTDACPHARAAKHTTISEEDPRRWVIEQTLVDPDELNDWSLKLRIDLDRCDAEGGVVMAMTGLAAL